MRQSAPGPLYPITAGSVRPGWSHYRWAGLFLELGIRFFQVREKSLATRPLLAELFAIRHACEKSGAALIVNDRLDLALATEAAGVHLGQEDLPVEQARRLGGSGLILGLSTHSEEEFDRAQDLDVDYVAIGPVFESSTKPWLRDPLGPARVAALAARKRRPLVAIGGITPDRARRLWDVGVDSVAVISDIVEAPDPAARIEQYLGASLR